MTDEQAILAAIKQNHREDTPRLMYADYVEEQGKPKQAAFIREFRTGKKVEDLQKVAYRASGVANSASKYTAPGGFRESVQAKRASREASRFGRSYQHTEAVSAHDRDECKTKKVIELLLSDT